MKRKLLIGFLIFFGLLFLAGLFLFTPDRSLDELKTIYTNPDSRFVEVQAMQVHYRIEGKGFPLVLLHGTSSSLHTWDAWVEVLSKDFQIVRLDLPAFGLTGPHPAHDYSIDNYVLFLHEFLQKTGTDSCFLAGNSLGGRIAWAYALKYPKEVQKLILIDASGYPSDKPSPFVFRLARTPLVNTIVRYVTPKSLFKNTLKEVYGNDEKITDSLLTRYYELSLREGNRAAFIERAKTSYSDQSEEIKKIQCPVLIQWGSLDTWIPVEHARRFARDIKGSRLKIYEGIGHVPMEEAPEETLRDGAAFLKTP